MPNAPIRLLRQPVSENEDEPGRSDQTPVSLGGDANAARRVLLL